MELKQYWTVIRKRLWLLVLLVVVITTATGIYTYEYTEKQYTASTKLIVTPKQEVELLGGKLDLSTINSNIRLIATYKEIIMSPRIMNLVVQQYPQLGLTSDEMLKKVTVSAVEESQVMSLETVDTSYAQAAAIVNAVAAIFQSEVPKVMKIDNISVLSEANPADTPDPTSPQPLLNMIIGLVLSLMIGTGLMFLLDYLDDTIKTEADIREVLGLSTYSAVPAITQRDRVAAPRNTAKPTRRKKNVTFEV
ncbi:YveK family protein [Paenibacillus sp. IHBB 3054]|uniref:YveK family protein n=1 Tax=Paenibacillus sp. IHBB 3054 TaxID=3425689 RepID=UPI003F679775